MKYTPDQKRKAIRRKDSLQNETVKRLAKIGIDFPVKVYIEDGYYVIESKMNYDIHA